MSIILSRCVCVCVFLLSIMQSACSALYCHMWPVRLYHVFPHYLIKSTIFEKKKLLNIKCVFWFSLQLVSETFLTLGWIKRDTIIAVHRSLSTRYSCQILMKLEFSGRIFDKSSNIKFHESPSSCSRTVSCGRTDIHGNFANAPKNAWNYNVIQCKSAQSLYYIR